MATFTWFNGNNSIYRYFDLEKFEVVSSGKSGATLRWDESYGEFDPGQAPWRLMISWKDYAEVKVQEGGYKGETIPVAGTITGITWFDKAGKKVLEATDLSVSLPFFAMQLEENPSSAERYLISGDHKFIGSAHDDDMRSGYGNDIVKGNGGNDYIKDMGGADRYYGGAGWDSLTYDEWFWNTAGMTRGIDADLAKNKIVGPDGHADKVWGIESVRGTHLRDVMRGDGKDNQFHGFAGNDVFDGRGGFDYVRYDREHDRYGLDGIKVDMRRGEVRDTYGATDKIKNIEGIRGTDLRDVFQDNGKSNAFEGGEGNDVFHVRGGDDFLRGDAHADKFVFYGNAFGDNVIDDWGWGNDQVVVKNLKRANQIDRAQDGDDAVIEFTLGGSKSSIRFYDTDIGDLSNDVFGL